MTGNNIVLDDLQIISNSKLIDWSQFSGKTILITGANGFLPAYMVETLLFLQRIGKIRNIKILALVRNIDKARTRFKHHLDDQSLQFLVQDVCEPLNIKEKVSYIVHAASQASPKFYGMDPVGTLSANVLGTINLLKFAQGQEIESFLYFSSSEVYGVVDESRMPIKENDYGHLDPLNIRSCYAESKRMGENICVSWSHQFGIPIKIVRPFHTYGPGLALDDGRVYADFISDIVFCRDIVMKSEGNAQRAFCYISDATLAFFLVLLCKRNSEAFNVGNPECEISILGLANLLVQMFAEKKLKLQLQKCINNGYIKSLVNRNLPDISKINSLGWFPKININEGFYRTIKSYE